MTSIPASRRVRAMILAPLSCPSSPGLATTTRILRLMRPSVSGARGDARRMAAAASVRVSAGAAGESAPYPGHWSNDAPDADPHGSDRHPLLGGDRGRLRRKQLRGSSTPAGGGSGSADGAQI